MPSLFLSGMGGKEILICTVLVFFSISVSFRLNLSAFHTGAFLSFHDGLT